MIRRPAIIGLLCWSLIAGSWLLIPRHAAAAVSCADVQQSQPFSPYVRLVLERAKNAQGRIEASGTSNLSLVFGSWIRSGLSAAASLVDARVGVLSQAESLKNTTACQYVDTLLLECAIADARSALLTQLQRESFTGILRSQALMQYLQERLLALRTGALDGTYLDPGALRTYIFDPQGLSYGKADAEGSATCGDGKRQTSEECDDANTSDGDGCSGVCLSEMCPYTSDYAPYSPAIGQGCSPEYFQNENAARQSATQAVRSEIESMQALLQIRNDLTGNTNDAPQRTIAGCVRGWCESDPAQSCSRSADCGGGGACIYGRRICEGNPTALCTSNEACGDSGPCTFQTDAYAKTTPRGAFSLDMDHDRIVSQFLTQRGNEPRAWPDDLRRPEEYPLNEREYARKRERTRGFLREATEGARNELRAFQTERGRMEAISFAQSLDGVLRITEELKPLREGIRNFSHMARDGDGMRLAARNLAYYLLRSCIHRPCGPLLERVIERTFTDICYPYTNGEYLENEGVMERCLGGEGQ